MAQGFNGDHTCMSFSAAAPASADATGYAAVSWTPASNLRVPGDLNATRAVSTVNDRCSGTMLKILGNIDEGNQAIELAFAFDNGGQIILHDSFRNNTPIFVRRTLDNGHITYYEGAVSSEGDSTAEGAEVLWKGTIELISSRIDVPA